MNAADKAISAVRQSMTRGDQHKHETTKKVLMPNDTTKRTAGDLLFSTMTALDTLRDYKGEIGKEVGERIKKAESLLDALKVEIQKAGQNMQIVSEISISPEAEELIDNPLRGLTL